jgi:hypothetical protein
MTKMRFPFEIRPFLVNSMARPGMIGRRELNVPQLYEPAHTQGGVES